MNEEVLLKESERHDIEYKTQLVIDGEVVGEVKDTEFEVVSSYKAEGILLDALNDYLVEQIADDMVENGK